MSITKKQKRVKGYQKHYEPSLLSETEQIRVQNLTDAKLANAEVERVARNIATAMANPQTPNIVRAFIKAYLDDLFSLDITETSEAILCLYPIACRKISRIPFVPQKAYIEALTGNDRKKAIAATKHKVRDLKPHVSITTERVAALTDILLDEYEEETRVIALIALIAGIGLETSPFERKNFVREVCHRAYSYTLRHSDEELAFIERAIKTGSK